MPPRFWMLLLALPAALAAQERAIDNFAGVGVRAMGMGGAYVGVADDFTAVYWNPAGLAQMRKTKPDLVIVDFMMSYVLDGAAVSREMHHDPQLGQIPILMVSAVVSDKDDLLFTEEDRKRVDAFMSKPVEPSRLVQCINSLMGAQRKED